MNDGYRLDCFGTKCYIGDAVCYVPYGINGLYKGKIVRFTPKCVEIKGEFSGLTSSSRFVKIFEQEE